jgi:hypothetical protein
LADIRRNRCPRDGESVESVPKHWQQPLTRARQLKWASPEQRLAANILKQPNLVTDRRGRYAEFGRGVPEAHAPGGGFESAQGAEGRQLPHAFNLDEFCSSGDLDI